MNDKKFVDLDKILKEKAPGIARFLPFFIKKWLKNILHVDDINKIMYELGDVYGLEFNSRAFEMMGAKTVSLNTHNVPEKENVIFVANHPLGVLDGMGFVKACGELRPDIRFPVNEVLKSLKNYGDIFIGIDKVKGTSYLSLRTLESVLETNEAIGIFPAGLVSRKQNGVIKDLPWKKSFITQAIAHKRVIVPVFIEGENSSFFYRFANLRKRLGIKANIELFFFPNEAFIQKEKTMKIHFGKTIYPASFDEKISQRALANQIKEYIYSEEFKNQIPFEECRENFY